jgi:hypothetical protein
MIGRLIVVWFVFMSLYPLEGRMLGDNRYALYDSLFFESLHRSSLANWRDRWTYVRVSRQPPRSTETLH